MTYQVARREFGGQTPRSMFPLVEVARRGDKVAFSVLYEHDRGDVFRFVLGKVRDVTDAEDLTQQTFVRAWEGLPQLLASSSFESWLSRIADNCVHNFWRSRYSKDLSLWAEGETAFSYLQDQRPDPEESLLFREHLSEALPRLPHRQRAILIWYSVEGFSLEEIAERLGISVSSVMAYLSVARRHFRAAYWPAGNKQSPNRETNALAQVEKRSVAEEKRSRQFEATDLGAAWNLLREPYRTAVQLYMEANTHPEMAYRLRRPLDTVHPQL